MAKFILRTTKTSGDAPLYTRFTKKGKNVLLNTGVYVDIEKWKKANESASSWKKFVSVKYGFDISNKLDKITEAMESCARKGVYDAASLQKVIDDVVFAPIRMAEEDAKQAVIDKLNEEMKRRDNDTLNYLTRFVAGIEDGTIRNKGNRYSENTVKAWKSFQKIFTEFYKQDPFTWDDINRQLADKFVAFLEGKGYLPKSINKQIINFRAIINYSLVNGVHDNRNAAKYLYKVRVGEEDVQNEIYLTEEEVQELYDMPLVGTECVYRDVFLCGVYTCQRFSDYSEIKEHHFGTTAKGTKVLRFEQTKTKNKVVIPILNNNLLTILRRYCFCVPTFSECALNIHIKNILKKLSEKVPSLTNELPTALTMKEREMEESGKKKYKRDKYGRPMKHRYEMVSSHTARRTGITLLYLTGKFDTVQMMSISGHKDVKTFIEYIRLTKDEVADNIARKAMEDMASVSDDGLF